MTRPLALFCFIDAFGWDILKQVQFLEAEAPVRRRLETTFGYSSAAVPSILTGRLPQDNGHWSCFTYSPETSPFRRMRWLRALSLLPATVTSRSRFRYHVSRRVQRELGFTGYFHLYNVPFHLLPLFDYSEKRDLFVPGGVNRGRGIFDEVADRGIPAHVSNWRCTEEENFAAAEAAVTGDAQFVFLYLGGFDALLHLKGTRHPDVGRKVLWYEERLQDLLRAARGAGAEPELYVFSDHGQADVTSVHDLMQRVDRLPLTYGRDYVAMYDSTMFRCWVLHDSAEAPVRALLEEMPFGRLLSEDEMQELGVALAPEMTGDLVFLLDEGALIAPSFMGRKPVAAMHGYHPAAPSSFGMMVTNSTIDAPSTIRDMYGVMKSSLERVSRLG